MRTERRSRIWVISLLVVLAALGLAVRLYLVQIVEGASYSAKADEQYIHPTDTLFDRGTVFFKTKEGELLAAATVKSGYFLYINPKKITDAPSLYASLVKFMPLDQTAFIAKATKRNDSYEEIAHRLDQSVVTAVDDLDLPGIAFHKEAWRYYPGDHLAAATVGLMGYKGDVYAGRYGLESYYDSTLERDSSELYSNFFAQIFNGVKSVLSDDKLEGDVVTTIEPSVQSFLERELGKINDEWQPVETGAIVIDPNTGDIVAMASLPSFDPNNPQAQKSSAIFSNPLVENAYEMGSIVKPLTMAAGIDAGVVSATSTYNDTGSITLNGSTISNFDGKARGVIPMQEVLSQSLNVSATAVMLRLGRDRFSEYFRAYGFGTKTGIDLPNETPGIVLNLNSPRDIEHATASFGQGIAVSPLQTVRALSSLANGGYLITPHVVSTINYRTGLSKAPPLPAPVQILKKSTSRAITAMLVEVVDKALINGKAKMEHYSIAAKTGTAQIANPHGGGYYTDRYLHSFFGYFPAYNPKFLVFFYQIYPKGAEYASATLTNPFLDTAKFLINYYNIPPDR